MEKSSKENYISDPIYELKDVLEVFKEYRTVKELFKNKTEETVFKWLIESQMPLYQNLVENKVINL